MYTVYQLQGLDFLLKRITSNSNYALAGKNLKIVIEFNNMLWHGDFIKLDGPIAYQSYIGEYGDIVIDTFDRSNLQNQYEINVLRKPWENYSKYAFKRDSIWTNPFQRITEIPLLFTALTKIIKQAEITEEDSPFCPFLLNAVALESNMSLPMINLENTEIKLVSIIEVP